MKTLIILLIISTYCFPQYDSSLQFDDETILRCFTQPDSLPQIIGGLDSLQSRLQYPDEAIENNIEGNVYVKVNIDSSGMLLNPVVIRGLGYGCDEEAVRLVNTSNFIPAIHNGKPVNCQITVPIKFRLSKNE